MPLASRPTYPTKADPMSILDLLALSAPTDVREWTRQTGLSQKAARAITGGLSSPGKMPCHSYGLPAAECTVGSQLRGVAGSVCEDCYALKGSYQMYPEVIPAQYRRLASLSDPQWADAMVTLIGWNERHSRVFRWHDSGDIQSVAHLALIAEVCERLPLDHVLDSYARVCKAARVPRHLRPASGQSHRARVGRAQGSFPARAPRDRRPCVLSRRATWPRRTRARNRLQRSRAGWTLHGLPRMLGRFRPRGRVQAPLARQYLAADATGVTRSHPRRCFAVPN